ncbi:MAG: hypothetical protein ACREFE_09435, partial [Limisphaerales bacterium]
RLQKISFAVGILFLILCGVGVAFEPREFFVSWLFAFIFWIGLTIGCFNGAMIHYLTNGRWGFATRRFLEAGFMTLPVMAIFFIPILFGLHELYPWARPHEIATDKIVQHRASFENFPGFLIRAIFYFAIWIVIAFLLRKWSLQQDETADVAPTIKMRTLSGPGIVIVPLLGTFAFVDWAMSIEPKWYSSVFPIIILAGQILVMFAFVIMLLAWMKKFSPFRESVEEKQFTDLGSFLLAFVLFWTYVAFAQILIIYSANEPHEIIWYLRRIGGDWIWFVAFIAAFHFFIPFFLLLFRVIKTHPHRLVKIAVLIFFVHAIEIFWVIAPTFYPRVEIHWTDFAAWLGMGGIWLGIFATNLKRHPLLARNDPRLENLLTQTVHAK